MANIIKSTGNDFEFYNTVRIAGKIIYKGTIKNAHVFTIAVKRIKNKQPNSKSEYTRIAVIFEGALGSSYDKLYETGDRVVITGFCQKVRNFNIARDQVKFYGLTMAPKYATHHEIPDHAKVNIRGRISRTIVISNDLLLVYLYTNVHKKYRNPNKESDKEFFENDFVSETPVAIFRNRKDEHDANIVAKELTKGTWLDISGFIKTRERELMDNKKNTEQQIQATKIFMIGESQSNSAENEI